MPFTRKGQSMDKITLGYAPTRRSIFNAPAAVKYRALTKTRLEELEVNLVDIDDINGEGLLYDDRDLPAIAAKFKAAGADGLFLPHCNFDTEYLAARLAKEMGLPVLLWDPRDEAPDEKGIRLRDSQCGLFATGKVLRCFGVPFTYMTNCRLGDGEFERGVRDFLGPTISLPPCATRGNCGLTAGPRGILSSCSSRAIF
jgi:L-fucose isomerase-like protein